LTTVIVEVTAKSKKELKLRNVFRTSLLACHGSPLLQQRRAAEAPLLLGAGRAAIHRYLSPPSPQQQTRRTLLQRSIAGTDRQTDGRTDGHRTVT